MSSLSSLQDSLPLLYHSMKGRSHTSITSTKITSDTISTSCPEFRDGYRIQRRAYEKRSQTPTLASVILNRRAKNEYVEILKHFYHMDAQSHKDNPPLSRISNDNDVFSLPSGSSSSIPKTPPAKLKSILKLPDVKFSTAGKVSSSVRISLPSEGRVGKGDNSSHNSHPPMVNLMTKIPPPVPFQLLSGHSHLGHRSDSLSSSPASSDLTTSILEAVKNSGKTPMTGRPLKSRQNRKRPRPVSNDDSKRVAMKVSLPCRIGCCYCVYSSILGPVKVFLSRGQRPKQEPWLTGIRDGYGRLSIPVSRKSDVIGLVYDANNYSLHPPAKGQRPLYPFSKNHIVDKTQDKNRNGLRGDKRNKKKPLI